MNQVEHIEKLIKFSTEQSNRVNKLQKLYTNYMNNTDDDIFSEIVSVLDEYCLVFVRRQLWKTGCYSKENEDSTLQEARISVWEAILKDKENDAPRKDFTYYAFGIYKNKVLDLIRKKSRKRAKYGDEISIDEPFGETGTTILEMIEDNGESIDNEVRSNVYGKVFYTYCFSMMNLNTYPPRSLALYYARILPHMQSVYHSEKTIPDTKAASAKWAYEEIEGKTVGVLKEDSEKTLKNEVSNELCWCDSFLKKLNEKADIEGCEKYLKDVIYTAVYDKGKIEDWADNVHKVTYKATIERITSDKELSELVKEYISGNLISKNLTKGGRSR